MEYGMMFEKIRKMIEEDPDNITILEEVIDVDLQMKYFKLSLDVKKNLNVEEIVGKKEELFLNETPIEDKKLLLSELASVNDVEMFRTIERYKNTPDIELKEWSILAYQESRMLIQSSLMDKSPVFISTGLGGKRNKLRYSVVLFSKEKIPFSQAQQSIIEGEIDFMVKKTNSEIEEVEFIENYCRFQILIPLKVSVKDSLFMIVGNSNELGEFIDTSFLVTNVKRLNSSDIHDALQNKKKEKPSSEDIKE